MAGRIFVNLPVQDLPRSMAFFEALGFAFDPDFTDARAACMVVGDDNLVMLLTEPFFTSFTGRPVPDTGAVTEVIVAVQQDSPDDVDRIGDAALAAGARPAKTTEEASPMHTRSFYDPDGHHWEIFYMAATQP
ncbi:VOC family protein [Streptomyces sp. NRRL F-5123]|uniref:VOC family protein n=1 Tax=Streptomyces sp. NRRL F-5123 TaxID=1463856 RepID=UPI0004E17A81|nr:VOC family protein [Streptomyces sp. NRRL F-5123]